jgi:hypothetical protein
MNYMTILAKIQIKSFILLALGVGTLSLSLSAMYVRWADAPGTVTGFYRLFISTIIIFPFFIKRNIPVNHLTWSKILPPILGGICMAGTFSLWNTSLFYTNVASAAMIGNISPLWVSIAAWWLLRERLGLHFDRPSNTFSSCFDYVEIFSASRLGIGISWQLFLIFLRGLYSLRNGVETPYLYP